jgi:hypothetical protein
MGTPTQTGIVNAALAELGSTKRIQSIDEGYGVANDALALWDTCMRTLLSEHPWNWAIGRALLNPTTAPEFGYARAFTLPPDNLRWLPASSDDADWFDAREEGGLLLTDAETANVRYVSAERGGRVAVWPPYFVRAMELAMAERLAEPVTQDESIKDRMEAKASDALRKAKRRDGIASNGPNRSQVTVRSDWLQARDTPYNRYRR